MSASGATFHQKGVKLGLSLWCLGMVGVVTLVSEVIPGLLAEQTLPLPLWVMVLLSSLQTGVILAIAVWVGVKSSSLLGLSSPLLQTWLSGDSSRTVLSRQWQSGLLAGILAGLGLAFFQWLSPQIIGSRLPELPLLARVLYGGVTEEVLIRWGLMSGLLWVFWRIFQHGHGGVKPSWVWLAIVISALLFGVGHLPYASVVVPALNGVGVVFIVLANTVFGIVFGYLYWRRGLESAMMAHGVAHLVAYLLMAMI